MDFFKRMFGRKDETPEVPQPSRQDVKTFQDLVELHSVLSFEKQLLFGKMIKEYAWQFDKAAGTLSFGEKLVFPAQVIGTVAFEAQSFRWAWANAESEIPEALLKQAHALKALGEERGIKQLKEPQLKAPKRFEHVVGCVASGIFQSSAYYCANYGSGTLVLTIDDPRIPSVDLRNAIDATSIYPRALSQVTGNHQRLMVHYFTARGFQVHARTREVEATKDGITVIGEFNETGKFMGMNIRS